jgi:hypothetical protein
VERWLEDSGNAALAGRELPPDEALAADERITAWARKLKAAGLDGGMDEIRARAYLDLLLGKDSRPGASQPAASQPGMSGPASGGFAGRVTLTVPLATLTDFADRPGELAGLGPVDPWLARDLAGAAAQNPTTTWCVTVTDEKGHAVGHGCARPGPKNYTKRAGPGPPGFTFTPASRDGPPGRHDSWRLHTPGPDLIVTLDPLTTDPCDHRFQANGHDPGVKLRHLSQVRHATCTSPVCRRRPRGATLSTTPRMRRAAGRACVMGVPSVGTTTGSSSTPSGGWTSFPTGPSDGPPRPAGPTTPNPPATRSSAAASLHDRGSPARVSGLPRPLPAA